MQFYFCILFYYEYEKKNLWKLFKNIMIYPVIIILHIYNALSVDMGTNNIQNLSKFLNQSVL